MSTRRIALRQAIEKLAYHSNFAQLYDAQELIQREKLISKIPNMDNYTFTKIVQCFDRLGFKNKLFWGALMVNLQQRLENVENFGTLSQVLKTIHERNPESVSVEEMQKLIVRLAESDKLTLSHLSLIPFLAAQDPNNLDFWARLEKPILLLLSTRGSTTSFRDASFNYAIWYMSEIKVGSSHYWHAIQGLVGPFVPSLNTSTFSRVTYGIIKTHFMLPAFKQVFLDNVVTKFQEPSSNSQDHSMMIYTLTMLEGPEKNELIPRIIRGVSLLFRKENQTPLRQSVELLAMYNLDAAARDLLQQCIVDFYNSASWKVLETFTSNIHILALAQGNLDPLKRNLILERMTKENLEEAFMKSLMSSPYSYPYLANVFNKNLAKWSSDMEKQFFRQFSEKNASNWGLNSAMQLVAGFELAHQVKAGKKFFDDLAQQLLGFCRSSKIEIDFLRGITNEHLMHWNRDHVVQLYAVVSGALPLHSYLGHLQRRYQRYNYLRTLDEILSLLLIVYFKHGKRSSLILDSIKEIIMKYKPTHRLEYYYLTDPDNPALIDLNLPANKKEDLLSILEVLYGKPDLREYEQIELNSKTAEVVEKKYVKPEPETSRNEIKMKPASSSSFIDSSYHRMNYHSLNSLFGLSEKDEFEKEEVEFVYSKDSLGEEIVHLEVNVEQIKSGILKHGQADAVLTPNPSAVTPPATGPAKTKPAETATQKVATKKSSVEKKTPEKQEKSPLRKEKKSAIVEAVVQVPKEKAEPAQLFSKNQQSTTQTEKETKKTTKTTKKAAADTEANALQKEEDKKQATKAKIAGLKFKKDPGDDSTNADM